MGRYLLLGMLAGIQSVCTFAAELPPPSAFVKLDLKKWPIRVLCLPNEKVPAESLLADIGHSKNLIGGVQSKANTVTHRIVKEGLGIKEEFLTELPYQADGVEVGIKYSLAKRGNAIVLEIKPQYSLPSGDIEGFSIARGTSKAKQLTKLAAEAKFADQNLSRMRSELAALERAHSQNGGATQNAGGVVSEMLKRQRTIGKAEQLAANRIAINRDLAALRGISEYGRKLVKEESSIYVRFHFKDVTQAATEK